MKTRILILASVLAFSAPLFTSCATTSTTGLASLAVTLGPPIAQVAQERLALVILKGHPGRVATLQAISADLAIFEGGTDANEISEAAIRTFVAERGAKWGLLPGEENLIVTGLLATRSQFLASTGATIVLANDPRIGVYVAAIRQGIADGIASAGQPAS